MTTATALDAKPSSMPLFIFLGASAASAIASFSLLAAAVIVH